MNMDQLEGAAEAEPGLLGSRSARWSSAWIEPLLRCESLPEVERFIDGRFAPSAPVELADVLLLKMLFNELYELGSAPSEEGWRRVRLALSAVRPNAKDEVEALLEGASPSNAEQALLHSLSVAVAPKPPSATGLPSAPSAAVQPSAPSPWTGGGASTPEPAVSALPMNVERYANLVARTEELEPSQVWAVHAEFGVGDGGHRRAVDCAFRQAFAGDHALLRTYEEYLHHFRQWRRSQEVASPTAAREGPPPSSTSSVDSTAFMTPIADHADPVPFRGKVAAPSLSLDDEPHPAMGSTGAVDLAVVAAIATSVFAPVKDDSELALPLDKYAVVVLLTENADEAKRSQVHREYGIVDEAARRKLDQDVGQALRKDARLRETFRYYLEQWKGLKGG